MRRGRSGGVAVKLLTCKQEVRGLITGLAATISETGYFLLPSRIMAEISQATEILNTTYQLI